VSKSKKATVAEDAVVGRGVAVADHLDRLPGLEHPGVVEAVREVGRGVVQAAQQPRGGAEGLVAADVAGQRIVADLAFDVGDGLLAAVRADAEGAWGAVESLRPEVVEQSVHAGRPVARRAGDGVLPAHDAIDPAD